MGKSTLLEKGIFESFVKSRIDNLSYGILIGHVDAATETDYIFLPLETPLPEEDITDDDASPSSDASPSKPPSKASKHSTSKLSAEDWDVEWISNHAMNVYRMLPGACYVRGFYTFHAHDSFNKCEPLLRKILLAIHQCQCCIPEIVSSVPRDQIALFIDPHSKKFLCKSFTCSTEGSASSTQPAKASGSATFRVVDVKMKTFLEQWIVFSTRINVSVEAALAKERNKESILQEFQKALNPFLRKIIMDGRLLVNGELPEGTELVATTSTSDSSSSTSGYSSRTSSSDHVAAEDAATSECDSGIAALNLGPELNFVGVEFPEIGLGTSEDEELVGKARPKEEAASGLEQSAARNELCVQGRIPALALLPDKSTVASVAMALKEDIVRSLNTRLNLLTDELQVIGGELHTPLMMLPQRVLVTVPLCPRVPLSDYKFLSESTDDVVNRVRFLCRTTSRSAGNHKSGKNTTEEMIEELLMDDRSLKQRATRPGSCSDIDENCINDGLEKSDVRPLSEDYEREGPVLEKIDIVSQKVATSPTVQLGVILAILVLLLAVVVFYFVNL